MKKLMKPVALLFVIAVSTGAYAQQEKPAAPLTPQLHKKPDANWPSKQMPASMVLPKSQKKADNNRFTRRKSISAVHSEVK